MRPDRKQRISTLRNIAGALILGLPFGLLGTILVTLLMRVLEKPAPALMYFPLVLTLVYTVVARVTVVRAWNDRANRLARWPTHR